MNSNPLLTRIKATPILGNADSDSNLLAMLHELLIGDYPGDDKLEAMEILDKVMGEDRTKPATMDEVVAYIKLMKELDGE